MKIGVMLRHLNELGGVVVYTKNIIENLLDIDKKNEYIFLYNNPSFIGTYSRYKNVKEVVINISNKLLWDQIGVPRAVRSEKIDLVFNPKLSIPLFAPSKKVFTLHGLEQFALPNIFRWYDHIYFRIMTPLYCRRANIIIVMTNTGKNDLIKYLNVKADKIKVIYESYHKRFKTRKNKGNIMAVKQKYNLPEKYIFFIGGITPLKNFSNIIKSFNIIRNKIPIKLVVAGFKRWKYASDMDLIRRLKLQNDVKILGFVPDDDLPYLYHSAQCLIFPSLYEGFGIPILEAQACECPVICSKTGCTPEVSGGAALLVNPYNRKEIVQSIYNILNNKYLRKKLIAAGLENVKKFNWSKTAKKTLKLFEEKYQP
jgi:glycosyltransferase involved in cell wall biosynthesis